MKNLTLFTFVIALAIFSSCKDVKDAAITKLLETQAERINKNCPIQLNAAVRVDSCKVLPKKTLKTYATILYVNAADFDAKDFERLTKPALVYSIQTSKDLKEARENEIAFIYSYNDDKGKSLGEITIISEDYNKPIDNSNKGDVASMKDEDINSILEKSISGMQDRLPMSIGNDIDLVDCEVLPGKILKYTYVIKNQSLASTDTTAMKVQSKTASIQMLKNTKEAKDLIDAGVTYLYIYKDKDEKHLCQIDISAKDL